MKVALRWRANRWEKAPLLCRIFGHVWFAGWWGHVPYLRAKAGPIDNLGTHHVYLTCKCWRCDKENTVAMVHDWAKPQLGSSAYKAQEIQ